MTQLLKNQDEIDVLEREKVKLQSLLSNMETEYKMSMKKASVTPEKSTEKRTLIEHKRTDLNNLAEQLEIFKKRKEILFEEIKSLQLVERKRYENSVELEKNLIGARTELQDLRMQKDGLESMTHNLKDAMKSVS